MNRVRHAQAVARVWWVAGLVGALPLSAVAAGQQPARPSRLDYSAFQIIAERNIFNPNRGRRGPALPEETRPPNRVDALTLVGTMIYRKGPFAFFDGTRPDYRRVLQPGGTIADYKVADIGLGHVKLENGSNHLELKVGMQLRRADDGPWQITEATDTYASLRPSWGERREEERRGESRGFDLRRGESRGFDGRRGEPRGFEGRRGESRGGTTPLTPIASSPPAASSSGPALTPEQENEILQRLMRRREEESR